MDVDNPDQLPEAQVEPLLEDTLWFSRIEVSLKSDGAASNEAVARAKDLIAKQEVSVQRLKETAEVEFFEEIGWAADAKRFMRTHITTNTKLLYAQQKYNLLREESEGFGKAINALFQSGKAALTQETAPSLLRELRALIGYFDLDPIRLADIVLEGFASQPENLAYLELMRLFPSDALNHILGFKFANLAEEDSAISGLYAASLSKVAAHLIKAKLICVEKLLPHLQPSDDDLQKSVLKAQADFENTARTLNSTSLGGGKPEGPPDAKGFASMALAASTLVLAALPLEKTAFSSVAEGNQKLSLTAALIRVGAWPEASRMLVWLSSLGAPAAAHPTVQAALCSLLASRLEPFHSWLVPQGLHSGPSKEGTPSPDLAAETMDILHILGFRVASDPVLFTKIIRIVGYALGRHLGTAAPPEASDRVHQVAFGPPLPAQLGNTGQLQNLLQNILLPGLQLVPANVAMTHEIWRLLQLLPYQQRFSMYAKWQDLQRENLLLYAAASLAVREVKKVLRRISTEDTPEQRQERKRLLGIAAKAIHANPLSALEPHIAQATGYPAMREVIAETLRYVTPMGFDVLTHLMIDHMASPHREKLHRDGLNVSSWLQHLAGFVGLICLKYADADLHAILQYLVCRLKAFEVSELVVVKEIITSLSGIDMVHSLNTNQLEATAGGETLRAESVALAGTKTIRSSEQRRNAMRLLAALQKGPPGEHLLVSLLVLLAQQRQYIATQSLVGQLKLMLELFDQCTETLSQYIKFLQKYLPRGKYEQELPSMDALVTSFGLDVEVAWQTIRPLTSHLEPDTSHSPEDGEVDEQDASSARQLNGHAAETSASVDAPGRIEDAGREKILNEAEKKMWQRWKPSKAGAAAMAIEPPAGTISWDSLVESCQSYLSDNTKCVIWPDFYLVFWSLQYYDIHVPEERYQDAIGLLRQQIVENSRLLRDKGPKLLDQRELDDLGIEQKRLEVTLEKLSSELLRQKQHVEKVMARLATLRDDWNSDSSTITRSCTAIFIQDCLLPRCLYSAEDAAFAGNYVSLLTKLAVRWPVAFVYNMVFGPVLNVLACSSEREAQNLAITIEILLSDVTRWQESPEMFGKECFTSKGWSLDPWSKHGKNEPLPYDKFVMLYCKWLKIMAMMLVHMLKSGVYIQMRNALLVLQAIRKVFPRARTATDMLLETCKSVRAKETREDLKLNLTTYINWITHELTNPASPTLMTDEQFNKTAPPAEVKTAPPSPKTSGQLEIKKEPGTEAAPAAQGAAPAPAKKESTGERAQASSRKPPTVPAAEVPKEKPRDKEHRSSKREATAAERTSSVPGRSKKRSAQEPAGDEHPSTKEAKVEVKQEPRQDSKQSPSEARTANANGQPTGVKSPQGTEKRKPSVLSPDAERFVPRAAREGSSKPEESAQPAAEGSQRQHKRARTEDEPRKDKKKDKDRGKERPDKEGSEKEKGEDGAAATRPKEPRTSVKDSAATAPSSKARSSSRQPEGVSPKPQTESQDPQVKREARREKEKRSEKDSKAGKEEKRDKSRDPASSSRHGEDSRKGSSHDKPAAEKDGAPASEAKQPADRPAKRGPTDEPARKSSARRLDAGDSSSGAQPSRHRTGTTAEASPSLRPSIRDSDRRDQEQVEDGRQGREHSVPRETVRRSHSRIPSTASGEGPKPLGQGLQNRLSRGPIR